MSIFTIIIYLSYSDKMSVILRGRGTFFTPLPAASAITLTHEWLMICLSSVLLILGLVQYSITFCYKHKLNALLFDIRPSQLAEIPRERESERERIHSTRQPLSCPVKQNKAKAQFFSYPNQDNYNFQHLWNSRVKAACKNLGND